MQGTWTAPDALFERLERLRRSPRFARVPTASALVRRFVEEGLNREENPPNAAATAPGAVATDTKGNPR